MIHVIGMREPSDDDVDVDINTTSRARGIWPGLSPFNAGPCRLYDGYTARNVENAWQFAKVYDKHVDDDDEPTDEYWDWAEDGWKDSWAHRYPMGRNAIPLYSLWRGERLDYVEARKQIYVPVYAAAVKKTKAFRRLRRLARRWDRVVLRDFDGYDHRALDMTLTDVLNDDSRKMGHAFVLAMMLTRDEALEQCGEIG